MKRAKRRTLLPSKPSRPRPHYRLADLLAQMPEGKFELSPEQRAWDERKPVGREFGADKSL